MTHDLAQSEDVVSNAFLRVYERAEQFDSQRPFEAWFYRIVVSDAIKRLQTKETGRKCAIHSRLKVTPRHLAPLL
ncbi:MAG: hypothetical protein F4Y50_01095 [Dehalococcoidia bacterium]|nr:hypothetical protein [Dehalococcoidia bacterium]MYD50332.1 hypothetical protein [Dehalococcoidia bacterium]